MNQAIRGQVIENVPLAPYTTWRVGGPAERLFLPADVADLQQYLHDFPESDPLTWLGLGSNVLIRDRGVRGSVILTKKTLTQIQRLDTTTWRVEAGTSCAKFARETVRGGCGGGEFLAGIPGTMGGALAMNAGAFGGETWEWVVSVETVDRQGVLRERPASDFVVGYRNVQAPPGEHFTAAMLKLRPVSPSQAEQSWRDIQNLLEKRKQTQPIGTFNCGSVFQNPTPEEHQDDPERRFAGKMIEQLGLKGHVLGDACVSEKHANFILNRGQAKAAEVEALVYFVQKKVYEHYGIQLRTEVKILGEA